MNDETLEKICEVLAVVCIFAWVAVIYIGG